MPSHFSHLLQPLDVSCFSFLKKAYDQQIETSMRLDINHVDKEEFLDLYTAARKKTLKNITIKNGFKATGLVSYNSEEVLTHLHSQLHTSSPSDTFHGSQFS